MNWTFILILVLLIINIPVYKFIFGLFFSEPDDLDESVRYTFTPNIVSLFRGEYWKDRVGTARLQFPILLCALVVFLEYVVINKIIDFFL